MTPVEWRDLSRGSTLAVYRPNRVRGVSRAIFRPNSEE